MRRLMTVGVALTLMACVAPAEPTEQSTWSTGESGAPSRASSPVPLITPSPVTPRVASLPLGSWVRDELGTCVERQDWLVIAPNGVLDHVLADRNSCGESRLSRYVGRWTTDQQLASLRWSNRDETSEREVTYWAVDGALQFGAYVPVDGGWYRRDSSVREIQGHTQRSSVEIGLRIENIELTEGAYCRMSATVTAALDDREATETFDFDCRVSQDGGRFLVVADGMWNDGGWQGHLERQGIWDRHGAQLGALFFEGFQPVLHTVDGQALWHERADSVYRFTEESPPLSTDDLAP